VVNFNAQAMRQAAALDKAFAGSDKLPGPLHGVPILVKDNIETEDLPTTFGSVGFTDYQP
jgi:Asp-tRNA(Asn)/Glu-tRNA(Gln) amidotransferase A subunit family amidase